MSMTRSAWSVVAAAALLALGVGFGLLAGRLGSLTASLPPASSALTVIRPTAGVLTRIQELKRLESVSFHMERVLDLTEKQSRLFGLIETEDAILLVAAA